VPVTFRSVLQRLNRQLKKENKEVKEVRLKGDTDRTEYGEYFIVDTKRGEVVEMRLTAMKLAKMAHDIGVLKAWEVMR
jgi:hypothetical protein